MVSISEGLRNAVNNASAQDKGILGNPVATAIGGAIVGSAITGAVIAATRRRKKSTRKVVTKRRSKARRRATGSRRSYKYARTAGKRKDTSTRRIRMTKNGQPYVILKSGKARFIKKSSARSSRKRKGGRY